MSARIFIAGLCMTFAALTWVGDGANASPIKAVNQVDFEVPSSKAAGEPGESDITLECRGNERTSVMIKGDHRPVTDMEILVFEPASAGGPEKVIAHGKGTRDLVGVVFVPARTGMYRIVFRNHAEYTKENPYNRCYLTIK